MKTLAFSGSLFALGVLFAQAIPTSALAYGGIPIIIPPAPVSHHSSGSSGQSVPSAPVAQGQVLGASTYNFSNTLAFGSTGQDVTELQKLLISLGYLHITAPTGWFGPLTFAAVQQYQAVKGISPIGIVGPLTRLALNQGTTPIAETNTQPQVLRWIEAKASPVTNVVKAVLNWSAST